MERYKLIEKYFLDNINFENNEIIMDNMKLNIIADYIPDFIDSDLDSLTNEMSNFYNQVQFPNYDDFEDYESLFNKGINNFFTKKIFEEIPQDTKVLELGCGTGQLSLFLAKSKRQIFAVDISNGSLILGENFRKKHNIENIFFMKMDVFNLKFKPNTFDYTISNGVLHHTKNAEEAFRSLVEVTKPGGILIIGLYHKYGRLMTRFKQKLAKVLGNRIAYLDKTSRNIKSKDKRKAWVTDQFMNPHETLHTPNETMKWFDKYGVEFLNLIPHYDVSKDRLIKKNKRPKISFFENLFMAFDSTQIQEGGFFVIVGMKK